MKMEEYVNQNNEDGSEYFLWVLALAPIILGIIFLIFVYFFGGMQVIADIIQEYGPIKFYWPYQ